MTATEAAEWTVEQWAAWKAQGGRMVTWIGFTGDHRIHARLLSVSKAGLRCSHAGIVERWHPGDVRPGHLVEHAE